MRPGLWTTLLVVTIVVSLTCYVMFGGTLMLPPCIGPCGL